MSVTLTVFRVETPAGEGPYIGDCTAVNRWGSDHQPSPRADGLGYAGDYPEYSYGFADLDQLKAWFWGDERAALDNHGYRVGIYSVPADHVRHGKKQVQFKKTLSERISDIPLRFV